MDRKGGREEKVLCQSDFPRFGKRNVQFRSQKPWQNVVSHQEEDDLPGLLEHVFRNGRAVKKKRKRRNGERKERQRRRELTDQETV
jgi:hypothetical protein